MVTSIDKSIVGVIMGVIFLVNAFTGWHFGVEETTVTTIVSVLTPVLIYFVPNKDD
jgi:hypothetical protein